MEKVISTKDVGKRPSEFRITSDTNGRWRDVQVTNWFLVSMREEARKQTALLTRIDERLKRNGLSLAKRNRK